MLGAGLSHALGRLIRNAPFSLEDQAIIDDLGFGAALMYRGNSVPTQDDDQ